MRQGWSMTINPLSRWILWSALGVLSTFIVWANWAELDVLTRARGQVIVSSRNQVIQAADGGIIAELLVREGDRVERGALLVRFEQERARAAYHEANSKVAALRAQVARLSAEVFGQQPDFSRVEGFAEIKANQLALFKRRQAAIAEEIAALEQSLALVRNELELNLPLLASGDVSRAEVLKLQRQVADLQGQITNRRNKYFQDAQAELAKAREELEAAEQLLAQRREQLEHTELYAPMDGIVRNIRLTTRGAVARAGEEIMQIVPVEGELIVEAKVRPADIAFIKPGLPATVKLDAYDYAIYGALPGTVSYISPDALSEETQEGTVPYYRVHISITQRPSPSRRGNIDIQPGMTATIEIRTGKQTVWRYLTKPITKTLDESLGER